MYRISKPLFLMCNQLGNYNNLNAILEFAQNRAGLSSKSFSKTIPKIALLFSDKSRYDGLKNSNSLTKHSNLVRYLILQAIQLGSSAQGNCNQSGVRID